jgi:hypothetical protein
MFLDLLNNSSRGVTESRDYFLPLIWVLVEVGCLTVYGERWECLIWILRPAEEGEMVLPYRVALLLSGLWSAGRADSDSGESTVDRKGKFFSIFNIVSFPNNICNSTLNQTGDRIFIML